MSEEYQFKYFYMKVWNEAENETSYVPQGTNAKLTLNKFYKKYTLTFNDDSGTPRQVTYTYLSDYLDYFWKMKDDYGTIHVAPKSYNNKEFGFILAEKKYGSIITFELTNQLK